jgi:hypothetical protein
MLSLLNHNIQKIRLIFIIQRAQIHQRLHIFFLFNFDKIERQKEIVDLDYSYVYLL